MRLPLGLLILASNGLSALPSKAQLIPDIPEENQVIEAEPIKDLYINLPSDLVIQDDEQFKVLSVQVVSESNASIQSVITPKKGRAIAVSEQVELQAGRPAYLQFLIIGKGNGVIEFKNLDDSIIAIANYQVSGEKHIRQSIGAGVGASQNTNGINSAFQNSGANNGLKLSQNLNYSLNVDGFGMNLSVFRTDSFISGNINFRFSW